MPLFVGEKPTSCHKTPRPLGRAQQRVDAACAGANIESAQPTAWLLVGCRVHQVFQP